MAMLEQFGFQSTKNNTLFVKIVKVLTLWHCCCHIGTAIKDPVLDMIKQSFVIFDIRAFWCSRRLNSVWHKMLYKCTHMVTVGVKGLNVNRTKYRIYFDLTNTGELEY